MPFIALVVAAWLASSCGYRSALPSFSSVSVEPVRLRAPAAALGACLTAQLREGLAQRGVTVRRGAPLSLEGELLEATTSAGTLVAADGPDGETVTSADQHLSLAFRVRLVSAEDGVVWGPVVYRVETTAALVNDPLAAAGSADLGADRACRDTAERVLADLP